MLIDIIILAVIIVAAIFLVRMHGAPAGFGYYNDLARQAGHEPESLKKYYWAAKIALAILVPLAVANIVRQVPLGVLLVLLAIIGFMIPDITLMMQRSRRRFRILQSLSFYLDLVVSFLRSGLTLEESVNRAAVRGLDPSHPLAEEVRLVADEIAAGKDRAAAFGALAARTKLPDLQSIASALELGSRLGFPVAEILATQADLQREKRLERGRRRIDRATVYALFPVMLCGFPLFVLVVVVPTVSQILDTFKIFKMIVD